MSTLSVDTIQGKTTAGTVAMPAGMLCYKLKNSLHLTAQSTRLQTSTYADISYWFINRITPKFSSSKILVAVDIGVLSADDGNMAVIRLLRDQEGFYIILVQK